jgi:tRNA-2-methylthio-N6-dimethylallyladenosine synthase
MLSTVRFDMLYSFIYSARKGTPAAEMEQVPPKVQGERFDRLLALEHQIASENNANMVGKTLRVLCDGVSKNDESVLSGRTDGNKLVFFHGEAQTLTGHFVQVKIERAEPFGLYGEIDN